MSSENLAFFAPDLGRGPFTSYRIETAAVQLAAAIAQVRAPLSCSDDDLRTHAQFIRELADTLAPDWAAQIAIDVDDEAANNIETTFRVSTGAYSLLHCWLTDAVGGGETAVAPSSVSFSSGTVLRTETANKSFWVITPYTGIVTATVNYSGARDWYWAVSRQGRVYHSSKLAFTT